MLQKLAQLGTEIEGRYATNLELEDLEKYIASIEPRISAYEKIANQAEDIVNKVRQEAMVKQELLQNNQIDMAAKCHRDLNTVLRCCTSAMLINDLDRLREGFLLWLQTIVIALKLNRYSHVDYQILKEVITNVLTVEEMEIMLPALQLSQTLIGS